MKINVFEQLDAGQITTLLLLCGVDLRKNFDLQMELVVTTIVRL
jgi:hypothetical protein